MNVSKPRPNREIGVIFALVAAFTPVAAQAYVGPGAGLTAIGTLVALVAAVLLAVAGFVWYPVKRLLGRNKSGAEPVAKSESSE